MNKRIFIALILALSAPNFALAQEQSEAAENGSSFSFKSFLNRLVGSGASVGDAALNRGASMVDQTVDRATGQAQGTVNPQYPNSQLIQSQERGIQESIVRCMYLGKFIETNRGLGQEDAEALVRSQRAGELYANLRCNAQLSGFEQVWKNVDLAIGNCMANSDCQTLNPAGQMLPTQGRMMPTQQQIQPALPTANATATVGGVK